MLLRVLSCSIEINAYPALRRGWSQTFYAFINSLWNISLLKLRSHVATVTGSVRNNLGAMSILGYISWKPYFWMAFSRSTLDTDWTSQYNRLNFQIAVRPSNFNVRQSLLLFFPVGYNRLFLSQYNRLFLSQYNRLNFQIAASNFNVQQSQDCWPLKF